MQKNNGMKLVVLMLMVVVIAAGLSACSGKNGNDSKTRIIKDGAGRFRIRSSVLFALASDPSDTLHIWMLQILLSE